MPLSDWPAGERPRERLYSRGAAALSDTELLAVVFGRGIAGSNAVELARECLQVFGSLRALLNCETETLMQQRGMGPARVAALLAAVEIVRRSLSQKIDRGDPMLKPQDTQDFLQAQLRDRPHEVFCCLLLDNRHRIICFQELFRGTIDGASVHSREVVKLALSTNAAAVIFAHNHPSGVAEPSQADERITRKLQKALALVDIRVLDHFVVGDGKTVSFAERGLL
ncbi:MAG: DNA repair protein RadC [Gammaproteobacteria bacterium]|nr:DNA repair protein RadC [Gammaproteobacteria bacterium]